MGLLIQHKRLGLLFGELPNCLWVLLMAGLKVRKLDGTMLLDSEKITYGLVKSGYLTQGEIWPRKRIRSINLDPSQGTSWADDAAGTGDQQWTFTVPDCVAPMLFLVGDGCLNGVSASGNTRTYIFGNASGSTKVYAFDQMREMGSGPRLRCRNVGTGAITFNSYMVPLNIIAQVTAPGPGTQQGNSYVTAYAGGNNELIKGSYPSIQYSRVRVPLGNEEYAVHLPFSRNAAVVDNSDAMGYSVIEGAGGYAGGVQFMFGPAGGSPSTQAGGQRVGYYAMVLDRMPVALVTRTSNLPFPFN